MSAALFIVDCSDYADFSQWEHEAILDRLKQRLARQPDIIKLRKAIIEHVFGTIKEVWAMEHYSCAASRMLLVKLR